MYSKHISYYILRYIQRQHFRGFGSPNANETRCAAPRSDCITSRYDAPHLLICNYER